MRGRGLKGVSVVIPVFNSESTLEELYDRLASALEKRFDFEVVYVDDGSRDGSWDTLRKLRRRHPGRVKIIRLSRNFGQHNAILCGFHHARHSILVTLDDDLQHPPEEIPNLLRALAGGLDVVYGRYRKRKHTLFRNIASWAAGRLLGMAIPELYPGFTSFRALRASVASELSRLNMPFTFLDGGMAWITDRVGSVPVRVESRKAGSSGYGTVRLFRYTLNILTTFSDFPLRVFSVAGFLTAGLGFFYGGFLVVRMMTRGDLLPGWTSLMAGLLFFSGLILAALGILGEYVGRINHKTTGKPRYIEREPDAGSS